VDRRAGRRTSLAVSLLEDALQHGVEVVAEPGTDGLGGAPRTGSTFAGGALDEADEVVEVGRGGREVGVGPAAVAQGGSAGALERGPEVRGVAQPAWAQLEPDEPGERLLRRAADARSVTWSTQPSARARSVSRRSRAARWATVGWGRKRLPCRAERRASGSDGSIVDSADSMASVSMVMLRA
jgi:hypothetical protein